ncbi:MAG: ABC transporter transmembrane domain-containing protein, partial [Verrucomicrobiota bacterium]
MAATPNPPLESAVDIAKSSSDDLANDRRRVFRRLLSYIGPYRPRLAWGILFGVLAGLVNGLFLLILQVVFDIIIPAANGEEMKEVYYPFADLPVMQDFAIKPPAFIAGREWIFALLIALSLPCIMLLRGVFHYLHAYCMLWINMKVLYRLRDESFSSLMSQSLNFFNQVKQGELIQTVANQTRTVADAGSQLLSGLIQYPIAIVAILVTALILDPLYTLAAITVFPLCILPVALISRKVRKAGGKEEEESEGLMVTLHESFSGVRLVKAHSREDYQRERFNDGNGKIIKFIMR